MPDLDQVINHRACPDLGVRPRSPVDRRVCPDLDIVVNHDAAELRNLDRRHRVRRKAKSILADSNPGMQYDARSNEAVAKCDVRTDPAIVADLDSPPNDRVCTNTAAPAEPYALFNYSVRANVAILGYDGHRADNSRGRPARDYPPNGIEGLSRQSVGLVGYIADKEGHPVRRLSHRPLVDKYRARTRANESRNVFSIFQKTHILWTRGFERTHVVEEARAVLWTQ